MNIIWDILITFLKIGAISFGGGYAVISMIQQEVVNVHHWISATDFINIVGISGVTPGPVAIGASIFVGYKMLGIPGAFLATGAVIAVPCLLSLLTTIFLEKFRHLTWVDAVLWGIKPAVIGLIAVAFFTISKSSIGNYIDVAIAGIVALLLFKTKISPVILLLGAAVIGILVY